MKKVYALGILMAVLLTSASAFAFSTDQSQSQMQGNPANFSDPDENHPALTGSVSGGGGGTYSHNNLAPGTDVHPIGTMNGGFNGPTFNVGNPAPSSAGDQR